MTTAETTDHVVLWRAMLQLAQAAHAVLECEIPESEGLPPGGLPILRLLRLQGPKSVDAIAVFLSISRDEALRVIEAMLARGVVRHADGDEPDTIELDALGVHVARQIVIAQRDRIAAALAHVPEAAEQGLAKCVHNLAYELVSGSTGIGITCARCWANETRECIRLEVRESCAFCLARCVDYDEAFHGLLDSAPQLNVELGASMSSDLAREQ